MNNTNDAAVVTFRFHVVDYLIMVGMTLISLGIGLFYGCFGSKQNSTKEYFRANGSMNFIPVALSLLATFSSSIGMLGLPAEVYLFGFNAIFDTVSCIIGIPLAAYCFLPVFYDLQVTSVFEYLERRFNRVIRICGSLLAILTMLLAASFNTYGPALALSQATGFHIWGAILGTTLIGTFYTALGGIKAVIWADTIQMIVLVVALLAVVIKGTIDVGGVPLVINKAIEGQRLQSLSFSFDPRIRFTFWGFLFSCIIAWTADYGVNQLQVQRYMTCPNQRAAAVSILLNFPGTILLELLYCFMGLVLYARYRDCDPFSSNQIEKPDQVLPLFVMESLVSLTGLSGLFVAGVYSASLSTTSSVFNSFAAVILEDYIRPCERWKDITDETATKVSKILAIVGAVICLVIVSAIKNLGSIVETINYLVGTTIGGGFALFSLGMFFPKANAKGTLLGLICGFSVAWWLAIGNQIYQPHVSKLPTSVEGCPQNMHQESFMPEDQNTHSEIPEVYKISYLWIRPIAFFITFIVGGLASCFIGSKNEEIDEKYFSPPVRFIMKRYFKSKGETVSVDKSPSSINDSGKEYEMSEMSTNVGITASV